MQGSHSLASGVHAWRLVALGVFVVVVAIAGLFAPVVEARKIGNSFEEGLSPATATNLVGTTHTLTVNVFRTQENCDPDGEVNNQGPVSGAQVTVKVISGPNLGHTMTGTTNAQGNASVSYSSSVAGTDHLQADANVHPTNCGIYIGSGEVEAIWIGPEISIDNVTVKEGNTGQSPATKAEFTVSLDQPSPTQVKVNYATMEDTATSDVDFIAKAGTLTFAPNQQNQTITIDVIGDTVDESAGPFDVEQFFVKLSGAVGATIADDTGVGVIVDDDEAQLQVEDVTVTEGNTSTSPPTPAEFTVSLTSESLTEVTVDVSTADDSAVAPDDYGAGNQTLTFAPGETSKNVIVEVVGDLIDETDEQFFVHLSNPDGADIADDIGVVTIIDDDVATLSIDDVTVTEGDAGTTPATFTVSLSAPSAQTVEVDYTTADGTAATSPGVSCLLVARGCSSQAGSTPMAARNPWASSSLHTTACTSPALSAPLPAWSSTPST